MPGPFLVYNENAGEKDFSQGDAVAKSRQARRWQADKESQESLEERGAGNAGVLWHAEKRRVARY